MTDIKVTEQPVLMNPESLLVRHHTGGWLAFYRQTGGEWTTAYPMGIDTAERRWDLCPPPLHTTKERAIEAARLRIKESGEIVVMEVRL